jgi:DNA-binding winged helix-turn-helix (wHTH) protein
VTIVTEPAWLPFAGAPSYGSRRWSSWSWVRSRSPRTGGSSPSAARKQRAVLAHLILRANRVVRADLLIDGLWGEEPPLQTYVYRLRRLLGDGWIEGRDGGYVLTATPRRSTRRGSRRS